MPLLYGEGEKAFVRLQEEILKRSDDETIFSWHYAFSIGDCHHGGLFATSPKYFQKCGGLEPSVFIGTEQKHYSLTNKGLYIKPRIHGPDSSGTLLMLLNCTMRHERFEVLAIPVFAHGSDGMHVKGAQYWRPQGSLPFFILADFTKHLSTRIYLRYEERDESKIAPYFACIGQGNLENLQLRLPYVHPPHALQIRKADPLPFSAAIGSRRVKRIFHFVLKPLSTGEPVLV